MANNKFYSERDLWNSKVFRSLSKTSILVYQDFRMKCQWQEDKRNKGKRENWYISNNSKLEYTYSEAEKRGISRASFMRTITELVEKGFIDISHSGSGGVKGDKSLYSISYRWRIWGSEEFIQKSRPKDIRAKRGFLCGDQHWKRKKLMSKNENH